MPATRSTRLFPIGEVSRPGMWRRFVLAVGAVADTTAGVQGVGRLIVAGDVAVWPVVESFHGDHRDDAVTDDTSGRDGGEVVAGLGEAEVEAVAVEVGFQHGRHDRRKRGSLHTLRHVDEFRRRVMLPDHLWAARRVARSTGGQSPRRALDCSGVLGTSINGRRSRGAAEPG